MPSLRYTRWLAILLACFGIALCVSLSPQTIYAATLPVDTTDHGVNADDKCSLVEAILAANSNQASDGCPAGEPSANDIIVLSAGTTYSLTTSYADYAGPTGLPSITSRVTISGNGAVIERMGPSELRLFHVAPTTGDLTVEDVTLRNGVAITDGGAIANEGTLTLLNTRVVSNTAVASGGGIYNYRGTALTIKGSTILSNTALAGGGIYAGYGVVTVLNSVMGGNRANEGGGLYSLYSDVTLTDTHLYRNRATTGGGLYSGFNSTVTIARSDILSNTAERGGGIYSGEVLTGTLTASTVAYNRATAIGGGLSINFGTGINLYYEIAAIYVSNSHFFSNTAAVGGAISIAGRGWLTLTNSSLIGNSGEQDGGGIANSDPATLHIVASEILSNVASSNGGGVYNLGTMRVTTSNLIANHAGAKGGALYQGLIHYDPEYGLAASIFDINGSRLLNNRAAELGSAIYQAGGFGHIEQSCLVGNRAHAVWNEFAPMMEASDNWWGIADGPSGSGFGHGDRVSGLVIFEPPLGNAIQGCPAGTPDSRLYIASVEMGTGEEIVVDTTAHFNFDETDGNCTLGEAILAANTDLAHDRCPAGGQGVDVIVLASGALYKLPYSYLTYDEPTGLPSITSRMVIRGNGATIERDADERFRLINVESKGDLTLEDVTLRNGDSGFGGAIRNAGTLTLVESRIVANTAIAGGGIFTYGFGKTTLTNSNIASNTAFEGGGLSNSFFAAYYINGSRIISNTSQTTGGGIYNPSTGSIYLTDSEILGNQSTDRGGGIYNQGILRMNNVNVIANSAGGTGGGLYQRHNAGLTAYNPAEFSIVNSRFLNNTSAEEGGAIRLLDGSATLHQSCIVGNSPTALSHLYHPGNDLVDATNNWWGAPDGPGGSGVGTGDSVSEDVIFSPYLVGSILDCPTRP